LFYIHQMGVKDLMTLIRTKFPHILQTSAQRPIHGNIWIDAPLLVMAAAKIAECEGKSPNSLVKSSLQKIERELRCLNENAQINFVFDGNTRFEKLDTVQKRMQANTKYSQSKKYFSTFACLEVSDAIVNGNEHEWKSTSPSFKEIHRHAKEWVMKKGLPMHIAKNDAEEYIARNMNVEDLAVTNDSDALAFGCHHIVQNYGKPSETWILLEDVLNAFQVDLHQFRTMCVFLGTDFNTRIFNCGAIKCFNSRYKSIEEYAEENQSNESTEWVQKARAAYQIFVG